MKDTIQGKLLVLLSFTTMLVYFWAIFLSPKEIIILNMTIREWAIIIPIIIIVYLFLIVIIWIGWAMATTPPPLPLVGNHPPRNSNLLRTEI